MPCCVVWPHTDSLRGPSQPSSASASLAFCSCFASLETRWCIPQLCLFEGSRTQKDGGVPPFTLLPPYRGPGGGRQLSVLPSCAPQLSCGDGSLSLSISQVSGCLGSLAPCPRPKVLRPFRLSLRLRPLTRGELSPLRLSTPSCLEQESPSRLLAQLICSLHGNVITDVYVRIACLQNVNSRERRKRAVLLSAASSVPWRMLGVTRSGRLINA